MVVEVDVAELAREQAHFDEAAECRERHRAGLLAAGFAAAGPAKGAAEVGRNGRAHADKIPGPGEPVAIGRFDREDGSIYVGAVGITTDDRDVLVVNWRAPAATAYFEATPTDPYGVTRKRTFRTEGNHVVGFDDVVFAQVMESVERLEEAARGESFDALLRELEASRSAEMRTIVQTISAAQHMLIRAPLDTRLVIQGGPGTGKTAVALHRVSWLLFNYREELEPSDVLVIGPSEAFSRYIRRVLPTLGDDTLAHGDLHRLMGDVRATRDEAPAVARLKGDERMKLLLQRALIRRTRVLADATIRVGAGSEAVEVATDPLNTAIRDARANRTTYLAGRGQVRATLASLVTSAARGRQPLGSALDLVLDRAWPTLTAPAFLQDLLGSKDRLLAVGGDEFRVSEINLLYRQAAARLADETWTEADIALLDEVQWLLSGTPRTYRLVIVDEGQDLSPMQWRAVMRRSRVGAVTVVGDIAQGTSDWAASTWQEVTDRMGGSELPTDIQELEWGYRVPKQVFELAAPVLEATGADAVAPIPVREGPTNPRIHEVSREEFVTETVGLAREHASKGLYVGIIAPQPVYRAIADELTWGDVNFARASDGALGTAITLLEPGESKGLEFDAVVLVDPAAISESPLGMRLLYIALTRTTHHLDVVQDRAFLPLPGVVEEPFDDEGQVAGPPDAMTLGLEKGPAASASPVAVRGNSKPAGTSRDSLRGIAARALAVEMAAVIRETVAPASFNAVVQAIIEELGVDDDV